jgi:hypothetical protein
MTSRVIRSETAGMRAPHFVKLLVALLIVTLSTPAIAADADQDWQAITALDAGPQEQPKSAEAATQMVLAHLAKQEKALRGFAANHPQDARVFESRLRLARLLQIRADFERSDKPRLESRRILDELEKTATFEQRPELEFARITRLMRGLKPDDLSQRDELLKAARQFRVSYPSDRRLAAVFAEIAVLYDNEPKIKEGLLEDARAMTNNEELRARIDDDLKRVRLLGRQVSLRFTTLQGKDFKMADMAGRPFFLIFFANFSPISVAAVDRLQQSISDLPRGSVRIVGFCLDERREVAENILKSRGITWPVGHDGKGWESPFVRELGINGLPTVWLIDGKGNLRSLNALEGAAGKARQLFTDR